MKKKSYFQKLRNVQSLKIKYDTKNVLYHSLRSQPVMCGGQLTAARVLKIGLMIQDAFNSSTMKKKKRRAQDDSFASIRVQRVIFCINTGSETGASL